MTAPIEGPWALGVIGGLTALLVAGTALLSARLIELARETGTADAVSTIRLVDTRHSLDIAFEGTPGGTAIVIGPEGRRHTVDLDINGRARFFRLRPAAVEAVGEGEPEPTLQAEPSAPPAPRPSKRIRAVRPAHVPPVLHLVTDSGPSIAITFDGGISSNRSAELLDLLLELEMHATLFVTGQFIERHPSLVRRALLEGHEVGNHTFSHPHLTSWAENRQHRTLPGITREVLLNELERSEQAFRAATGRSMAPLWRAPYGEENGILRGWALEAGYLHVRWSSLKGHSLDSLDWVDDEHSGLFRDSRRIMNRLLSFPRLEGGIVLMHLATDREEPPWAHLPAFVKALRKRDIEPCRVTELLDRSSTWKPWLDRARTAHPSVRGPSESEEP